MLSRQPGKQQKPQQDDASTVDARSTTDSTGTPGDIQSSIKEVSSAIVHFVNDKNNRIPSSAESRSRSTSPSLR